MICINRWILEGAELTPGIEWILLVERSNSSSAWVIDKTDYIIQLATENY